MNHSCDPNVKCVTTKSPSARLDVMALRPIDKGDEICIDYVGAVNITNVSDRKKLISDKYCFECKCPKCISEN
jgi:SET domain-containing protein